jgi:hypothetical protein
MRTILNVLCGLALLLCSAIAAAQPATGGTPLPADGGEPGKVALAALEAQRAGDFEAWKKAFHPRVWQGFEEQRRKMLERGVKYSPTSARILGGTVDGDRATVNIEATFPSATRTTDADLERFEGQWRVTRM